MLRRNGRREFIERYEFSSALRDKLREELGDGRQVELALQGLRNWFAACLEAGGDTLGMPSRVVDVAWHQMILFTREYHEFCAKAFGHYLHHEPESVAGEPMEGMLARTVEVLDGQSPGFVPVPFLFAVDAEAGVEGGHVWRTTELGRLRQTIAGRRAADRALRGSLFGGRGWSRGWGDAGGGGHDGADGGGGCGGGGCGGSGCGGGG